MSAKIEPGKPGPKLNDTQKQAIIAQALAGTPKTHTAQQFGVSRNTVHNLLNQATENGAEPAKVPWRARFDAIPDRATAVIEQALDETREDFEVYKAAGVAQAHLKGIGVYTGDAPQTNTLVLVQHINSLPPDIRDCYLSNDDVIEVTPECDKDNTSALRTVADNSDT